MNYKIHTDPKKYYREQVLLYVPFIISIQTIFENFSCWQLAYAHHEKIVIRNHAKFCYNINSKWGNIEEEENELHFKESSRQNSKEEEKNDIIHEDYDISTDIPTNSYKNMCTSSNVGFEIAKHPQIMNNTDYFNLH